jgi:hypothetical protein
MALTLGVGFRPYLLPHIRTILGDATPQYKIEPVGFVNLLSSQSRPKVLRLNNAAGHRETVQIKYKQRYTVDFTDTVASCDNTNVQAYREMEVNLDSFRQIAIHIEDETIANYTDDASKMVKLGTPPTDIMNELLDEIMNAASAILEGVNLDLMTIAAANVGVNRRTGLNTATAINLNRDGANNLLTDGLNQILADYTINGGKGVPQVFGSGLFHNFMLQQNAKSADQSGYNTAIQAAGVKFYHDLQAANVLGANEIIVAQPNTLQWIEYMQYTGFKAGLKPDGSEFFVISLPMQIGADVKLIDFDVQLKYNSCPEIFTDAYYGTTSTLQKGYNIIISKKSGLFTVPADAYRGTDLLTGNRGTLLYSITNTCDSCQ